MSKRKKQPIKLRASGVAHLSRLDEESLVQLIDRVRPLIDTLELERLGWPPNISVYARRIAAIAQLCLDALSGRATADVTLNLGYELARYIGEANLLLAAWGGLKAQKQARQSRASGGSASHAETNTAKAEAIKKWLSGKPHKRGEKKAFAYEVAEATGVDQRTVYDDWLSRKSIEEFQAGS